MAAFLLAGCTSGPEPTAAPSPGTPATPAPTESPADDGGNAPARVDPREDGFEVAFGEFSVELEADVIRPGPVTFVIRNGGELVHGFEMEIERQDDGFKVETETIDPGETLELELDLPPGEYKVECFIEGHDDLGMEALLEVRRGAPLVRRATPHGDVVDVEGFSFRPPRLQVAVGAEVVWTNRDAADHTVTSLDGELDSGAFGQGGTFSHRFGSVGRFAYRCDIHPTMQGTVVVAEG